ncbi:MAG: 1-acyl-sn-glycerol-3-phosphate acyltransferase [Muribaculaceae bacterium]|nr:1-acyl-sn-glycerol-3-phosphate acyltransferase [Muribaculaceae bacterium]
MDTTYDFSDIAPFDDSQFGEKMRQLVKEPGFEHAVRYILPDVDFGRFTQQLLEVPDKKTFQTIVMKPFLAMLAQRTTSGITIGGIEKIRTDRAYTFISNHRDIVLDASFLNYCFLQHDLPTSEVAIGDNLLIYEWITDLVKLNKSFIVKRNLRLTKALEAAKQLSAYIHYAIGTKHESVWIAQREGRAKDSNDMTQESVIKMLALGGREGATVGESIAELNIMPVAISYEYDPNDYLKAREFLLKRLDPEFKKSQRDDLFSMETGLLQPKGRIHFELGDCINAQLDTLGGITDKVETVKRICAMIDCSIHGGYHIYPVNYVAYDLLHGTSKYSAEYTTDDVEGFKDYVHRQLGKVQLESAPSDMDMKFMYEMMLSMYANPLRNKLQTEERTCRRADGSVPVK